MDQFNRLKQRLAANLASIAEHDSALAALKTENHRLGIAIDVLQEDFGMLGHLGT